ACRAGWKSSALWKDLLEGAHRDAFVDAALVERVGADQLLGFLARGATHDDQRTVARPLGRAFQRPAEDDLLRVLLEKFLMRGAMLIAQRGGVGTVETNDGVHGMFGELWLTKTTSEKARTSASASRSR